jgi:hypothetical protein
MKKSSLLVALVAVLGLSVGCANMMKGRQANVYPAPFGQDGVGVVLAIDPVSDDETLGGNIITDHPWISSAIGAAAIGVGVLAEKEGVFGGKDKNSSPTPRMPSGDGNVIGNQVGGNLTINQGNTMPAPVE